MKGKKRVVFFDAEGTLYVPRKGKSYSSFWEDGEHSLERAVEHFKLNDGVLETLERMKKMGFTMVVVSTHKPELLPSLLEHFGVKEYFSDIIINGDKGTRMIEFLKEKGIPKNFAVAVGNNRTIDIEPAERVGIKGYLLARGNLESISELIYLL